MNDEEIDGMIDAIQETMEDENYTGVDSLCLLTAVKLMADIDKKLNRLDRIALASFQMSQ